MQLSVYEVFQLLFTYHCALTILHAEKRKFLSKKKFFSKKKKVPLPLHVQFFCTEEICLKCFKAPNYGIPTSRDEEVGRTQRGSEFIAIRILNVKEPKAGIV